MRRFRVPEIVLGFGLGVIFFLFVTGITSYQTEHCGKQNQPHSERPTNEQPSKATNDAGNRKQEPSQYNQSHPIACGVRGLVPAALGFMNENEGFFVGTFTGLLFLATILLWRSTNDLWEAGERHVEETRRIGEAQVRAYVHIKNAAVDFIMFGVPSPRVGFIASNSGQSPARSFLWNITLQYPAEGLESVFNPNWLNEVGYDIAANSDAPPEAALVPNMGTQRLSPGTVITVIRVKIEYRFTDVFGKKWFGEAYFAGTMGLTPTAAEGLPVGKWMAKISQMPKPRDWDRIGAGAEQGQDG